MAVTKTTYNPYVTLVGTLAEVVTQLNTDGIAINRVRFIWDSSANKVNVIYQ
jgi:hypothetical protein